MSHTATAAARVLSSPDGLRLRTAALIPGAIEALTLALVCLSPWAFGAVEPLFEFLLYLGLALLLLLWTTRIVLDWRLSLRRCPVAFCLLALCVLALWQIMPLSRQTLAWIAPATAEVYDRLLPREPEQLPAGEPSEAVVPPPGSTLSLYPGATRQEFVHLLAVLLLFVVVRNNVTAPAALYRLSLAALVNGALLALFGLIQFFHAPAGMLYWTYPVPTQVFGPFLCRHNYPAYLNVCIGLGTGLFLASGRAAAPEPASTVPVRRRRHRWGLPRGIRRFLTWVLEQLRDPRLLGVHLALGLMLVSVLICQARGGILALLAGAAVCLVLLLVGPARPRPSRASLGALAALAFLGWLAYDQVEARLTAVWKAEVWRESRVPPWTRSLVLAQEFPLWGTGYGTYPYVEPWHRDRPGEDDILYEHASNEYLEAVVEGGWLRLAFSVAAILFVYRFGYRAVRRHAGHWACGLALGGLFAFTTLVVHSFGDFGLHLPAVAVLATVLCACLGNLADTEVVTRRTESPGGLSIPTRSSRRRARTPVSPPPDPTQAPPRRGRLAPLLGAGIAGLALFLAAEGWRAYTVQRYRLTARQLDSARSNRDDQIACLEAGARLAPEYARLQVELAQAHLDAYEEAVERRETLADIGQVLFAAVRPGPALPLETAVHTAASLAQTMAARGEPRAEAEQQLARRHRVPALRHYLHARDACPVLAKPQVRLAANVDLLARADERLAYLQRAQFLTPADPELWYLSGLEAILDGRPDQTAVSWRRCLELSDTYLLDIIDRGSQLIGTEDILDRVLPEKPALLLQAALRYSQESERRPFLKKALTFMNSPAKVWARPDVESLLEYGHLYPEETRRELKALLELQPEHSQMQDMLNRITNAPARSLR